MADNFHCYLPKPSAAATSDRILPRPQVMRKWEHYKAFKRPTLFTLRSLFHCWKHWCRFSCLDKRQALDLKILKRQRLETLMLTAQQAANRHGLFGLRRILNQCCPEQRRVRFQLRHPDDRLASPNEEFEILCTYVQQKWQHPSGHQPQPLMRPLSEMPCSEHELAEDLRRLNPLKAMAPPFTPAIAWATHADQLASVIYPLLETWWLQDKVYIPHLWKCGRLTFVPKPQKSPTTGQPSTTSSC